MTPYEFEVLKDGVVIDIQSIHLPHIRFAWPEIIRLAKRFCGPGHKFRVKDDAGGIVILTGVDTGAIDTGERGPTQTQLMRSSRATPSNVRM